jgi:hypothetical protein
MSAEVNPGYNVLCRVSGVVTVVQHIPLDLASNETLRVWQLASSHMGAKMEAHETQSASKIGQLAAKTVPKPGQGNGPEPSKPKRRSTQSH